MKLTHLNASNDDLDCIHGIYMYVSTNSRIQKFIEFVADFKSEEGHFNVQNIVLHGEKFITIYQD